jgi:hypothetical protein
MILGNTKNAPKNVIAEIWSYLADELNCRHSLRTNGEVTKLAASLPCRRNLNGEIVHAASVWDQVRDQNEPTKK